MNRDIEIDDLEYSILKVVARTYPNRFTELGLYSSGFQHDINLRPALERLERAGCLYFDDYDHTYHLMKSGWALFIKERNSQMFAILTGFR